VEFQKGKKKTPSDGNNFIIYNSQTDEVSSLLLGTTVLTGFLLIRC
jgi:hypothetical protein